MTNNHASVLVFAFDKPVFSWIVEDATGKFQTLARICVSNLPDMSHLVFDTGLFSNSYSFKYKTNKAMA
jgi:hypothetical protein